MITKKIFTLVIIASFLTSCENEIQKSYAFIKEYNNAAPLLKNHLIYRTEAKIIGERVLDEIIIEIGYDLNLKKVDCETNSGVKLLPKSLYQALLKSDAGNLINNGAKINITFRSLDNYILLKETIDKRKMNQLLAQHQKQPNEKYDFSSGKNPIVIQILANINKSLPIENEDDQTKLIKLDMDEDSNIICQTEIPASFTKHFKSPESIAQLKETIFKRKNDQILLRIKESYNIEKIIYRYQNAQGQIINQIEIE